MKYLVVQQFIIGDDTVYTAKLNERDPIYEFDTYEECEAKAKELEEADVSGRKYKVSD